MEPRGVSLVSARREGVGDIAETDRWRCSSWNHNDEDVEDCSDICVASAPLKASSAETLELTGTETVPEAAVVMEETEAEMGATAQGRMLRGSLVPLPG